MNEVNELYKEVERLKQQAAALQAVEAEEATAPAGASLLETDLVGAVIPNNPVMRVQAHANGFLAAAFSNSGERFATVSRHPNAPFKQGRFTPTRQPCAFIGDLGTAENCPRSLQVGGDKSLKVWDSTTGTQLSNLTGGVQASLTDVAWTSDDRYVLGSSSVKAIHVYDITTGRERHTLTGHDKKVTAVRCFFSDKARAASCAEDRTVKVWDLNTGFCKQTLMGCPSTPTTLEVGVDGVTLVSGHFDGRLRVR